MPISCSLARNAPLWSFVGPLRSFAVLCGPLRSFAVFSHTALWHQCIADGHLPVWIYYCHEVDITHVVS